METTGPEAPPPDGLVTATAKPEEGPIHLPLGLVLGNLWKLTKKLGEGGCGAVYLVESLADKKLAALKCESNFVDGGSVLKVEVEILSKLRGKKAVCELLHCGRKDNYQYMVMSLLGECLANLLRDCNNYVSVCTMLRIGIHVLHGLKQIHDAGFVHRDIKPANLAMGNSHGGTDPNFIYVLDFGLSRAYIRQEQDGKKYIRKPRKTVLFRGTTRYCSWEANMHHEQSRAEDLWSLIYLLVEMRGRLPWAHLGDHVSLAKAKKEQDDRALFSECPGQMKEWAKYVRTLSYFSKPDYPKMYGYLMDAMRDGGYKFTDPWEWQLKAIKKHEKEMAEWEAQIKAKRKNREREAAAKKANKKISLKPIKASLKSFKKGQKSSVEQPDSDPPPVMPQIIFPSDNPFCADDFATDPLGL